MSARICAVCRASLGSQHLQGCTIGKPESLVIDAQCVDVTRENALLWVMLRLHQLEAEGLIKRNPPTVPGALHMTTTGIMKAIEYYSKNPQPGREAIVATCAWLFQTRMPVSEMTAEALTTLILDEGTTSVRPN